jgi:hypothetical protein
VRAWLRASMGREPLRCRERREAHYKIRNDACERKPLSAAELNQLFLAVDKKDMTQFGVRKLADVQLNGLQAPPPSAHLATPAEAAELMEAHTLTVLSYAAWRRRDQVVKSLLIAGADPTVCEARPGGAGPEVIRALRMVQSSAAVFLVEQIVRLRSVTNRAARRGWRAEPCACCGAEEQVRPSLVSQAVLHLRAVLQRRVPPKAATACTTGLPLPLSRSSTANPAATRAARCACGAGAWLGLWVGLWVGLWARVAS